MNSLEISRKKLGIAEVKKKGLRDVEVEGGNFLIYKEMSEESRIRE